MQLPLPNGGPRRNWFIQLTLLACAELGALFGLALGIRHAFDAVLVGGPVAVQQLGFSWLVWGLALVLVSAVARARQRPLGESFWATLRAPRPFAGIALLVVCRYRRQRQGNSSRVPVS